MAADRVEACSAISSAFLRDSFRHDLPSLTLTIDSCQGRKRKGA